MVLPIHVYGSKILREETVEVEESTEELQTLIDNMIETAHFAEGIGLAAPQVGRSERLFVVDLGKLADELEEEGEDVPEQPMVFINPKITATGPFQSDFEEGCLSIPDIREVVVRPDSVELEYLDRDFQRRTLSTSGMLARVIQHEYDHLDGILFLDHLSAFRRNLLRRKLKEMSRGEVTADYPLHVDLHA